MSHIQRLATAVLAAASILHVRPAFAQAQFRPLGSLGGYFPSIAHHVSADGSVVVGFSNSANLYQAFRWTYSGGMIGLGDLPGGYHYSEAFGSSANGNIVVGATDEGRSGGEGGSPFQWSIAGGMRWLGSLGGPLTYGQAMAASDDGGVIVGASQSQAGIEAFRWSRIAGMQNIGDLPGGPVNARAMGVSGDGTVIVGYGSRSDVYDEAFRWTKEEGMVGLGFRRSAALGISRDGKYVVGIRQGRAFRWTKDGGWEILPLLYGGGNNYAEGVSADGSVVVGLADLNQGLGTGEAFIWDPVNGIRDLNVLLPALGANLNGFYLFDARSVSADGKVIVGYGFNRQGDQEAFWAKLP